MAHMAQGGGLTGFEQVPAPETAPAAPEGGAPFEAPRAPEKPFEATPAAALPPAAPAASARPVAAPKDPTVAAVENVLEEGLGETYLAMRPALQRKFKERGERVAKEIAGMIASLKVNAGKILKLVAGWLKMIPGVNRFFLVQEAKLKTDRLVKIGEEERARRGGAI